MKQHSFIFGTLFLLAFQPAAKLTSVAEHEAQASIQAHNPRFDDIYVSFDYLVDAKGYQYGAAFYLYNPNDFTVNVQWQFVGSVNVNFSPTNSDRTVIPSKTKVWITNCTSADHSKAWNSGKVQWKY